MNIYFLMIYSALCASRLCAQEAITSQEPSNGASSSTVAEDFWGRKDSSGFVFAFTHGGRWCVAGAYNSLDSITLIQEGLFPARCADTGVFVFEEYDDTIPITYLEPSRNFEPKDGLCLARINRPVNGYRAVSSKIVSDTKTTHHLLGLVRSTNVLDSLLHRNGGVVHDSRTQTDFPSIIDSLTIVRITHDLDLSFYTIDCFVGFGELGPRVVIIDNSVFPFTGQCSYDVFRVFRLQDDLFIESGSSCCGCGVHGAELWRIVKSGPELVHADYSWSD